MGLSLAQWMIHGEVERDPRGFDVARFGNWTTPGLYRAQGDRELSDALLGRPIRTRKSPAARPFRTTAMYDTFTDMRAVWGQQYGLEVVNYYALPGEPIYETPTFRRSNAWEATRAGSAGRARAASASTRCRTSANTA